ncbi:hypothetical protein [Glaciibacter sp. 2TAF33]|uniref:hypothetical protein n=1 Tax=Glaciibacter sp. 2TAF33 TaxID=3233015 RepID=UPI003F8D9036
MIAAERSPAAAVAAPRRPGPAWLVATVCIVFGLLYAWDIWEAVGNLVGLTVAAGALDTRLSGFGWGILIGAILLPAAVYGIAFWIGRKRGVGPLALLLLVGLALIAVVTLDIYAVFGLGSLIV